MLFVTAGMPSWSARFPPWHDDAACKETPAVNFFPERGQRSEPAKQVCRRCLVRVECLDYALADVALLGIWGGTSVDERRELRRQRAA